MKHLITITLCCLLMALPAGIFHNARAQELPKNVSNYRLSGPYTHKNLTVFLVHGKDRTTKTFLTLEEALAQKKVRVYETKDVNELAIRNLSNQDIYVQSGDIGSLADLLKQPREVEAYLGKWWQQVAASATDSWSTASGWAARGTDRWPRAGC